MSNLNLALTLKTITRPGFAAAFVKLCAEPFPAPDKFRLARARRVLETALEDYTTAHHGLIRQYSADGQGDRVAPENLFAFRAALEQLGAEVVPLPLRPLTLGVETKLDANDISELLELLVEPEPVSREGAKEAKG